MKVEQLVCNASFSFFQRRDRTDEQSIDRARLHYGARKMRKKRVKPSFGIIMLFLPCTEELRAPPRTSVSLRNNKNELIRGSMTLIACCRCHSYLTVSPQSLPVNLSVTHIVIHIGNRIYRSHICRQPASVLPEVGGLFCPENGA